MKILDSNLWSLGATVLTASSAASGLPVDNSKSTERTHIWRSLSQTSDQTITVDLIAAQNVTTVAVANLKRQGGGAVKLYQGGSGGAPGAWVLVATLPDPDPDRQTSFVTFAQVSARHWKLEWTNGVPATPDTAEVGYVYLGGFQEPVRQALYPSVADEDPSASRMSIDGQKSFATRSDYSAGQFVLILVPESELTALRTWRRNHGIRVPFFLIFDGTTSWMTWLMRMTSGLRYDMEETQSRRYRVTFSWEEAR